MRIAFVCDSVFPWEKGGVQKRVWELGRRLADDHDVHWYGLHYWDGPPVIEREGVTLHGVGTPPDLYVEGRRSISEALSFSGRLVKPLLDGEFDVIDCQEFPYFPAFPSKLQSLVSDATLCLTWHEIWDDYWYEYLGWKGVFGKAVERLTAQLPDIHLAVSERTRRDLGMLGVSGATIIPNGIAMDEIASVEPAADDVDVLYVGRLIEEKGASLVVDALADLADTDPDVQCVLVGDGPERTRLEQRVTESGLGENVTFRGELDEYRDVLGLMKAADVFALPSRREGFGITVLEALACGTPVVTIEHPQNAAQELVDDGETGLICERTPSAMAVGIRKAQRLDGQACVRSARKYDWNDIADRMAMIYREVA